MCGRYANHVGAMHGWVDVLGNWVDHPQLDLPLSFNVAPTQAVPVVTASGIAAMRWGLIPPWFDGDQPQFSTFNARLVSIDEKPSFRHAWQAQQRCLLPAKGYYEWRDENGVKQAYFVCRHDAQPLMFAGVYEPGNHRHGPSCTVLTRPAEGVLAPLHHAMPVMLNPEHGQAWFSTDVNAAENVAWRAYEDGEYRYYPVSNRVNSVRNDGPDLIERFEEKPPQQDGFDF